jgi:hypothetical protein
MNRSETSSEMTYKKINYNYSIGETKEICVTLRYNDFITFISTDRDYEQRTKRLL